MTSMPHGAVRLTDRHGIGHNLRRIRRAAGISPDGLAARLSMSRSGVCRREAYGFLPAAALIAHLDALGYDVVAVPRAVRAGKLTPDRRTA